ncbi:alcohol dehydrogenase-like 2 isoform X1 [Cucumis melo var. makuwa]|uniref:Alcohol dehydrogenase-like 2 isoform X1 n=1 Tax=Cucumis melo var. makuwa TaxID=1194695 RepID=A0A5A7VH15_CUCMM|nr:alcohol dehydrogenase-like 2 isoform X1 [Cucumis melo var. makuwa]
MNNGSKISPLTRGKAIRCRAAVCRQPGEPLVIEEIEVDPPKIGEVRIKILCTSLCHSDVTVWNMRQGLFSFPIIFGHEAVGIVESIGEEVEEVKEGEMVLPVYQSNCKECKECKNWRTNKCSAFGDKIGMGMPRDGTSRFKDLNGQPLNHFLYVSSFSEYTVVDIHNLVPINPKLPIDKAALFGCGVPTGIGAAWNVADVDEGSTVAIFGLGFRVIKEETDGGADYCFECVGLASLMEEAIKSSREGWGKAVILGVEKDGRPFTVNSFEIINGITITGSLFGGLKPKSDLPMLIRQELYLDGLISHEVEFEDINKAFDLLLYGRSLRCLIWIDH